MYKTLTLVIFLLFVNFKSFSQQTQPNVIYIVDSIPVIEDLEEGNEISEVDISDVTVVKNKDTLKLLGLEKFDGAIYVFTKAYRIRPAELLQIPSTKLMERKNDIWLFHGTPYSGKFIDYYYSGRKQGEGILQNGKLEGIRTMFYHNGNIVLERYYAGGIENGIEKEYYEDGSLKQKGGFVNGKENGIWEMYFPNGQLKQQSTFINGNMEGETKVYYSTGKILAIEVTKNGKTIPDKNLEKINQVMNKGHENNKEGDYKNAIKSYSKAIEIDSTYAEAYFSRGTLKLNDFKFDEAIVDFDKALKLEPYLEYALSNRAFARIRKYQYASGKPLVKNSDVTVMASKDVPEIPESELNIICNDLKQAILLGDKGKMIMEAVAEFCKPKANK